MKKIILLLTSLVLVFAFNTEVKSDNLGPPVKDICFENVNAIQDIQHSSIMELADSVSVITHKTYNFITVVEMNYLDAIQNKQYLKTSGTEVICNKNENIYQLNTNNGYFKLYDTRIRNDG